MSRSIHTTKRDLKKERRFTFPDGDSNESITVLERQYFQKGIHKINERWEREAQRRQATALARIRVTETGPKREVQRYKGKLSDD